MLPPASALSGAISAILPWCKTMPPINCTSKWRHAGSAHARLTHNSKRFRNSHLSASRSRSLRSCLSVNAFQGLLDAFFKLCSLRPQWSSDNFLISCSSSLIWATKGWTDLRTR